jgi:hypothetical protein
MVLGTGSRVLDAEAVELGGFVGIEPAQWESPMRRPKLRAVQYTDYLDHIGADAIDDDPRCAADDQLAGQRNPSDASHIRVFRESIGHGLNAPHGILSRNRIILGYVVRMMIKVTQGCA